METLIRNRASFAIVFILSSLLTISSSSFGADETVNKLINKYQNTGFSTNGEDGKSYIQLHAGDDPILLNEFLNGTAANIPQEIKDLTPVQIAEFVSVIAGKQKDKAGEDKVLAQAAVDVANIVSSFVKSRNITDSKLVELINKIISTTPSDAEAYGEPEDTGVPKIPLSPEPPITDTEPASPI